MTDQSVKFYEVKQTRNEKDFLRAVVIGLGTSTETPADVFDGEFGEVACKKRQIVSVGGSAKVRCSASIGQDHQVEKEEYDHINRKYKTVTETKTEWSPFQTVYFAERAVGFAENAEGSDQGNAKAFRKLLERIGSDELIPITEITDEALEKQGFSDIKNETLQASLEDMKADAIGQCRKSLPGDRYKDFSATAEADVRYSKLYTVPYHDMTYHYSGNQYYMQAYASGECIVRGSIPKKDVKAKPNRTGIIFNAVSLLLSLILMVCAACSFESAVVPWIVAALATIAFILYKCFDVHYRKRLNHADVLEKQSKVIKILAEKGLDPLTERELNTFKNHYKKGHKHEMTYGEAFTLILYIASVIWFLVNYSQMSLINILLALMFVGLPVLIIYGLFIAPRKNK